MAGFDFRGPKVGRCNICGEHGDLTQDHTPPKGCFRPADMQVQRLLHALGAEAGRRGQRANTGMRFRSLCARCNNEHLGANYDPALIEFTAEAARVALFRESLRSPFLVRGQPQKIMRSVYGHLAAARVDGFDKGGTMDLLRNWFLSGTGAIPPEIGFYFWFYPYAPQIIVRGFGIVPDIDRGPQPFIGWTMKFFPLGFFIAIHPAGQILDMPRLDAYQHLGMDDYADLPLYLRPVVHPRWPEAYAGENGIILSGDHAIHATPIRRR